MLRAIATLALVAALLPAAAEAAEPLSHRLQLVAETDYARGTQAERARSLSLPAGGPGSLLRYGGGYVAQVRGGTVAGLEAIGAQIVDHSPEHDTITAALGRAELEAAADVAGVEAVTEELAPAVGGAGRSANDARRLNTCVGARTSEAEAQMRALLARTDLELDGAGVEVGVLSDSYDTSTTAVNNAVDDVATGDLPGPGNPCGRPLAVGVLQDGSATATDEGRAMLQHVHDLAPGARLSFATAFNGELAFAANIAALRAGGADVIVDDVVYPAEPFFQDGPIANAVTQATSAGAAYFSMAFNDNQVDGLGRDIASWEAAQFRPAPCPSGVPGADCMDFNPGAGTDATFAVGVVAGRPLRINLQWAEPISGVATDFDLFLRDCTAAPAQSRNVNAITQRPFEYASLTAEVTGTCNVVIARQAGSATPRLKFVVDNNGVPVTSFEYPTGGGVDTVGPAIYGHNGTAAAQTVAAIRFDTLAAPEPFSSRGPVTHYFGPVSGATPAAPLPAPRVLAKPDVTATDGAQNTFFGASVGGIRRFFGTSAAAPHAAAVAALQLQGNPALTPAQVRTAQTQTATAIGAFGPFAVGAGLVDARAAVALNLLAPVLTASAPVATADTTPDATFSANRPATFTCAVDAGAPAACTSPFTAPPLSEADHTITVTATDRTGRTDTEVLPIRIDVTAPRASITSGPGALTNVAQPVFAVTASEPGATLACRYDSAAFGPCAPVRLADGPHTFAVRATDPAGNVGPEATAAFTVDTTPPGAPAILGEAPPVFTFSTADGASFECRFDDEAFGPCSGPGAHSPASPLAPGAHTFEVRARDAAGNASPSSTRAFSLESPYYAIPRDTVRPRLRFTRKPGRRTRKRKVTFRVASSEPLARLRCRLDQRPFRPCKRRIVLKVKRGRHTLVVRGTDRAGNVSRDLRYRFKRRR